MAGFQPLGCAFERLSLAVKSEPQRLKPFSQQCSIGTTEVVPFPVSLSPGHVYSYGQPFSTVTVKSVPSQRFSVGQKNVKIDLRSGGQRRGRQIEDVDAEPGVARVGVVRESSSRRRSSARGRE